MRSLYDPRIGVEKYVVEFIGKKTSRFRRPALPTIMYFRYFINLEFNHSRLREKYP